MNSKQIVKLSNIIGITSIILLVYWVFTFIMIEVFGLKVFRENMTESFYLSIIGILALMLGSLIVNLMFNLSRIADKHNQDNVSGTSNKKMFLLLLAIFPLIVVILFGGDYLTSRKKEKLLIASAKEILEANKASSELLVNYTFSDVYINTAGNTLQVFSGTDSNFPNVTLLVKDTINGSPVFLGFSQYQGIISVNDTIQPDKVNYLYKTTQPEREYLNEVFDKGSDEVRYSSHDGHYELFYPYRKGKKEVVLYFSEQQRFGKIGS